MQKYLPTGLLRNWIFHKGYTDYETMGTQFDENERGFTFYFHVCVTHIPREMQRNFNYALEISRYDTCVSVTIAFFTIVE